MDASPEAKIYMGFKREISAQELYDKCKDGTIEEELNVIAPRKGDWLLIRPGTVHAAEGGLLIAEIQESSDLTFRLCDWGREKSPATARPMHLEEAFDIIDIGQYNGDGYHKGPLWENPEDGNGLHCSQVTDELVRVPQFTVTKICVHDPLKVSNSHSGSFIIYICIDGEAAIQVPVSRQDGNSAMESYSMKKGETVLVPADMPDFFVVPADRDTVLLEVRTEAEEEKDSYINPDTEPYLEGEDYGGVENDDMD